MTEPPPHIIEAARAIVAWADENNVLDFRLHGVRRDIVLAGGPHCVTCQCVKLHAEPRVADNPNSRSWHGQRPKSEG